MVSSSRFVRMPVQAAFRLAASGALLLTTLLVGACDGRPDRPPLPSRGSAADVQRVESLYAEYLSRHCDGWARCPAELAGKATEPVPCLDISNWWRVRQEFSAYMPLVEHGLVTFDEEGIAACWSVLESCTDATRVGCMLSGLFKGTRPEGAPCYSGVECDANTYCTNRQSNARVCVPENSGYCAKIEESESECQGFGPDTIDRGCGASATPPMRRHCVNDRCQRVDRAQAGPAPVFASEGEACDARDDDAGSASPLRGRICQTGLTCSIGEFDHGSLSGIGICTKIVPQIVGADEECGGGLWSSPIVCDSTQGLVCLSSRCVPGNLPLDASCSDERGPPTCGSGLTCLARRCRPSTLAAGQPCGAEHGECARQLYCDEPTGVCTPTAEGTPCRDDCPWSLACSQTFTHRTCDAVLTCE